MGTVPSIGSYRDLVMVGRGGFGTVYQATEDRFGRKVAIKVIRDAGVGRDVVARFERECLALGSLSGHPNIVSVHDQGVTDDGDLYLVMEFLAGGSFTQYLATRGRCRPGDAAVWGAALAGALETAHRSGIVHRDVKPENILFSGFGAPKLVDFGIARMRSAYETRTGFVSATLNHAAPEIVAGASVSPSGDVYSLASVVFTMLAGTAPFDRPGEDSLAPLVARIATAPPPDLRPMGVPPELCAVLETALAKDPDERFESAAAFGRAMRDYADAGGLTGVEVPLGQAEQVAEAAATMAEGPPTPAGAGPTVNVPRERLVVPQHAPAEAPRRRRWPIALAAAAVVALLAAGTAALLSRGDGESAAADPPRDSSVDLPAATVEHRCTGLVCTLEATTQTSLPEEAQWAWTVDGVEQSATSSRLKHVFREGGKHTVSATASMGGETGAPASTDVRLTTWTPKVAARSKDTTSAQGTVSIAVASAANPACRAGTVQLEVLAGQRFVERGRAVKVSRTGRTDVGADRGRTYRVVLARQDVRNGVCDPATSARLFVPYLPPPPTSSEPDPDVVPEPTPTSDPGGGGGPSTLPPKPQPG